MTSLFGRSNSQISLHFTYHNDIQHRSSSPVKGSRQNGSESLEKNDNTYTYHSFISLLSRFLDLGTGPLSPFLKAPFIV